MSDALLQAKAAEYRQQRAAALLRAQVYGQPASEAALKEQLLAAETELRVLTQARAALEAEAGGGVLLDTGRKGQKPGGVLMGADTTGIEVQVLLRQSYVPTGIVHLLDAAHAPLVTFKVKYMGRKYARLRLTSCVEGYSAKAVDTVELKAGSEPMELHQLPTFFPDKLAAVTELTRATLNVRIDDLDGATEQESTFPIWLQARTAASLGYMDPATGAWIDLTRYLAAWVTPNAPDVMRILRRAAELHPARVIVGYQVDAAGIEAQVKAIFEALKAENITYVNSVLSFGAEAGEVMQRVRLPREALANQSANCIDGAVLMASLLEAASLNPALVLIPGHAFLAWERQAGSGDWDYLETTMIGGDTFEAAQQEGRETAQRQRTANPQNFQLLSLSELRVTHGVTPME